jgi:FkbM family methyltransferase
MSQKRAHLLRAVKKLTKWIGLYPYLARLRRTYNIFDYDERVRDEAELYASMIGPGDLCFDVGANVGRKTEVFLHLGAQVVAFEPQPDCAEEIRLRCRGKGTFWVEECALGAQEGTVDLDLQSRSGLATVVADSSEAQGNVLSVPVYPLDVFVEKYGVPTFCKIDVEGYELQVLEGLSVAPDYLSIEYHTRNEADVDALITCLSAIEERYEHPRVNYTAGQGTEFVLDRFCAISTLQSHFADEWTRMPSFGDVIIRG